MTPVHAAAALAAGLVSAFLSHGDIQGWSRREAICATATALMSLAAWTALDSPTTAAVASIMATALPPVTAIDMTTHRIPNRITKALAGGGAAFILGAAVITGLWNCFALALVSAAAVTAFYLMCALLGSMGLGDVKLAGALTLTLGWMGPTTVFTAVVLTTTIGALTALVVALRHRSLRTHFAFGPSISLGFLTAALIG